jgi:hypothetical protein
VARLVFQSKEFGDRVIVLHLGANRFGRAPTNDFRIEHATVSAHHCEILIENDQLIVRDCESTNGTFIDGKKISESPLGTGQVLRLGDIELIAESTDITVAIPKFDVPRAAPPVVLSDGSLICPRHQGVQATHQCTHCREVLCDKCVHNLRRRGGKVLKLCPLCSHPCERIFGERKKKRNLLDFLNKTVKLPFARRPRDE